MTKDDIIKFIIECFKKDKHNFWGLDGENPYEKKLLDTLDEKQKLIFKNYVLANQSNNDLNERCLVKYTLDFISEFFTKDRNSNIIYFD